MGDQGVGNWYVPVRDLLGIETVSALRQMTKFQLLELSRKHSYSTV